MKEFTESSKFIVAFLVVVLIVNMSLGTKVTNSFLLLVLFGMILINSDKFNNFVKGVFIND